MVTDERGRSLSIEAASIYEQIFVPALFGEWAEAVAALADLRPGECVLDLACGTGVLARAAANLVGATGAVVGLDPDPGMLAVAALNAREVEWQSGVAESLPFDDGTFDAVVSQFGLMFFGDPLRALREVRRVLRPHGRTTFAVWNSLEHTPAYAAFVELLARLFGESVADGLCSPFSLGDRRALSSLFRGAGFSSPAIQTRLGRAHFPSLAAWVEADARGWLQLDDAQHQLLLAKAHEELRSFCTPDGAVKFEISAHIIQADR